jgi:hypothetical protein
MFRLSDGRDVYMQSRAVDEFCLVKVSILGAEEQYNERHRTTVTVTNRAFSLQKFGYSFHSVCCLKISKAKCNGVQRPYSSLEIVNC